MWRRFTRLMKSLFGGAIAAAEDPRMILEENIREMNDQVPRMNESIAMVKANVTLLEREDTQLTQKLAEVTSKVKAAIQAGRDDLAGQFAVQLESLRSEKDRVSAQLQTGRLAYDKALNVKKAFMREKERKTQEALGAIRDYDRAKWQSKVADTMEQFEVAGVSQTHDEMLRKVNEKAAINEARMEMALDSIDQKGYKLEEAAEEMRAQELVKQFKLEMGMADPEPTRTRAPQVPIDGGLNEADTEEKTIGRRDQTRS